MQRASAALPSPPLFFHEKKKYAIPIGLIFPIMDINYPLRLNIASSSKWSIFSFKPSSSFLLLHHSCSSAHPRPSLTRCSTDGGNVEPQKDKHEGEGEGEGEVEEEEARPVIAEILVEAGLPDDVAFHVASTCPKYSKMLRDTVAELDESSLWTSWLQERASLLNRISYNPHSNEVQEQEHTPPLTRTLSYSQKLKLVSIDKADHGKIPFLESIVGLSLSSSTHLARLLPSQSLPYLMQRVKYVKHVFLSGHKFDGSQIPLAGKYARQMMFHLSIPVADEDLQRTLSFFEKIEARRGGLEMLGSRDASFRHLIESFPRLLFSPVVLQAERVIDYLVVDVGIPEKHIGRVLLLYPPLVFLDIEKDIKPRIRALEKIGIAVKDVGSVFRKYPWIISQSIQENYKELSSFLGGQGVPRVSINRAIRSLPLLLGCSSSKFIPMMEQLNEMRLKPLELGKIVATSPQVLLRKPHEFQKVVSFLQEVGFDEESIGQILNRCPELFLESVESTLMKKIEFMTAIGISSRHLSRGIKKYPELFVCDVSRALYPRVNYLISMGLSKRDVSRMIIQFSPILGYSIDEVLKPKIDYLVYAMEKPLEDVVEYPRYLSYSLEKKIKPRHLFLKGRNISCSLKEMLEKNDEEFAAEYLFGWDASSYSASVRVDCDL